MMHGKLRIAEIAKIPQKTQSFIKNRGHQKCLYNALITFLFVTINTSIKFDYKQNHKKLHYFKVLVKMMIISFN